MRGVRVPALALSMALLLGSVAAWAQPERASEPSTRCSSYAVGTNTQTECQPAAGPATSPAIHCTSSKTGTDTHVECAPVAAPIVMGTRRPEASRALPAMPAPPMRCSSYAIGSSVYTDCR
jgi:hypothetical protein